MSKIGESKIQTRHKSWVICMSTVSPVFHTVVTVSNWTRKRTQSESIHSTILDIHVLKAKRQNSPFLSIQLKLDKDIMLLLLFIQKCIHIII